MTPARPSLAADVRGASSVEYVVLAGLVGVASLLAVTALGDVVPGVSERSSGGGPVAGHDGEPFEAAGRGEAALGGPEAGRLPHADPPVDAEGATRAVAPEREGGSWQELGAHGGQGPRDPVDTPAEAAETLERRFDDFTDGDRVEKSDLERVAADPDADPELRETAEYLLEQDGVRAAIDVGSGGGSVDDEISREDVVEARAQLEGQGWGGTTDGVRGEVDTVEEAEAVLDRYRYLADVAAGRGRRDGKVSDDDLRALLAQEGLPTELYAAAELLLAHQEANDCRGFSLCQLGRAAGAAKGAAQAGWDRAWSTGSTVAGGAVRWVLEPGVRFGRGLVGGLVDNARQRVVNLFGYGRFVLSREGLGAMWRLATDPSARHRAMSAWAARIGTGLLQDLTNVLWSRAPAEERGRELANLLLFNNVHVDLHSSPEQLLRRRVRRWGSATEEQREQVIQDILALPFGDEVARRMEAYNVELRVTEENMNNGRPHISSALGAYQPGTRTLVVGAGSSHSRTYHTLVHELGHMLDFEHAYVGVNWTFWDGRGPLFRTRHSGSAEWRLAWEADRQRRDDYFASNRQEGFAEAFAEYVDDPVRLASHRPNAFYYMLQDPLGLDGGPYFDEPRTELLLPPLYKTTDGDRVVLQVEVGDDGYVEATRLAPDE